MDVVDTDCSEGDTIPDNLEPLTRPLATRLHSRVMTSAYKYRLMAPEEGGGKGRRQTGKPSGPTLMKALLVVFLIAIVVLAALLAWSWNRAASSQVCTMTKCVDVSAYIIRKMNRSVDPCVDFYSYACGGWESTTMVPPERAKYDTFSEVNTRNQAIVRKLLKAKSTMYKGHNSSSVAKLKLYYQTCMDVSKIEADGTGPILKKIKELGSWSVSPDFSKQKGWDLVSSLVAYNKQGLSPLLAFYLTIDSKNSSRRLLAFSQAGLTLSSEEYLKDETKYKTAFLSFAVKVGQLLGGDNSTQQKMEAIYNLEAKMAQIFLKKEILSDPVLTYNVMTVAEFQKIIGNQVNVKRLMTGILGKNITDAQEVKVSTVDYFRKLGPLLASTDPQVLQDYMMWHMVQLLIGYLPQAFVDAVMVLEKVERGVTSLSPRWLRCMSKAEAAFGFVSSALYVDKTFPPESKTQALRIMKEVQTAFVENLDTLQWMDQGTRDRARHKAQAMHLAVGYPDWILDPLKLDRYYEKARLKKGEFLNNYFGMAQYEMDRMWAKQNIAPDRNMWSSNPDEANAYFSFTFNQIIIHAGLLQRPYFDRDYPLSFAYGSMGMISGHELTHGFDTHGTHVKEVFLHNEEEKPWSSLSDAGSCSLSRGGVSLWRQPVALVCGVSLWRQPVASACGCLVVASVCGVSLCLSHGGVSLWRQPVAVSWWRQSVSVSWWR
ncbi:hypothetical protein ACOMHN_021503 [Nucella lapillus]